MQNKVTEFRDYLTRKGKIKTLKKFDSIFTQEDIDRGPVNQKRLDGIMNEFMQNLIKSYFLKGWNYAACDESGYWLVYETKPSIISDGVWNGNGNKSHVIYNEGAHRLNWKDTLVTKGVDL